MNLQSKKFKKSIDGNFADFVKLKIFNEKNNKFEKKNTIHAQGNSISDISYNKSGLMIRPVIKKKFILNKKNNVFICNGDASIAEIHNFLIKQNKYCPFFPSYPGVSVGACVANGVHGVNSKHGIFNDYVKEIKIFNPNFGYKILSKKKK